MITIKNNIIPFGNYKAINLFGIVFYKGKPLSEKVLNHEGIHSKQMLEMGIVGIIITFLLYIIFNISLWYLLLGISAFYIWYGIEFLINFFFHFNFHDAYHDISLEEEAYNYDDNLAYLNIRKNFKWLEYIKPKSYKKES